MEIEVFDADVLVRNWGAFVVRGIAAILFGIMTFVVPGISLALLVLWFGAYALVDGVFAFVSAVRHRGDGEPRWLLVIEGIVGILAGVITLVWPVITAFSLLYVMAAWALVTGVFEVVSAIRLRKVISGEWLLALSGVLSVVLGVMLMLFPGPGALAVVLWIGAYALVFGVIMFALGLRLRAWGKTRPSLSELRTAGESA